MSFLNQILLIFHHVVVLLLLVLVNSREKVRVTKNRFVEINLLIIKVENEITLRSGKFFLSEKCPEVLETNSVSYIELS